MKRLSLTDKVKACSAKGEVLPLKGHMRLVLEDVRDGTQKVEEVDNLVTHAVQSILDHNYSGLQNLAGILPLRGLYGGVFCFQNAQTESADNFNPPSDIDNPLVAHAGDIANNTGSSLRGSPVTNDFVITDTSIKQVWLWDNTQGNGHISSISLVPSTLGNMGLKPFDDEFSPFSEMGRDQIRDTSWNEQISKQYPFSIGTDGKTSTSVWLDGTTFKEYTMRHDYAIFGIMRGPRDWQDVANRSATVRSGNNRFIFEDADYYYIARAASATTLQVDKINKTTFVVTQADCSFTGVSLWTGDFNANARNNCMTVFPFDGTYLYYPNSTLNGYYRLNLADNNDASLLGGTVTVQTGYPTTGGGTQFATPLVINGGLVVGSNYIINGMNVYPTKPTKSILMDDYSSSANHFLWLVRQGAAVYGNAKTNATLVSMGQGPVLCQMFLSTIANLPTARDKSTSQTMRVEYTSTEQT